MNKKLIGSVAVFDALQQCRRVLHPGVVGLIAIHHGKDQGDKAFDAVLNLRQCIKQADPQHLSNELAKAHAALQVAESFISGFEDDESQEGIDEMLTDIRCSIESTGTLLNA